MGERDLNVGTGSKGVCVKIVKETAFDVPPATGLLTTVTGRLAAAAICAAVTCAVSCVAESKVVGMALPLHCTVADGRKFVPVTTS